MNTKKVFDVLVVYTSAVASSASSHTYIKSPFQEAQTRTHYDNAYAYLLETCKAQNLDAGFTTSKDITGSGTASCYWTYKSRKWTKVNKPCYSKLIFDKFSPVNKTQKMRFDMLFSSSKVKPFNSRALFSLFFDKQMTFDTLQNFAIPTVSLEDKSINGIKNTIKDLSLISLSHPHEKDFSSEIVLKDRFGAGGNNIYLIKSTNPAKEIYKICNKNKGISFILQPFLQFKKGYAYKSTQGFTDIRLIYLGQKVVQAYVRIAKESDFRCNEHQGGQLIYINKREVPLKVRKFSQEILNVLGVRNELYALDFVVSDNGNIFLMEGNIRPGVDWNLSLPRNERMAKKLIRKIVEELYIRTTPIIPKFTPPSISIHPNIIVLSPPIEVLNPVI